MLGKDVLGTKIKIELWISFPSLTQSHFHKPRAGKVDTGPARPIRDPCVFLTSRFCLFSAHGAAASGQKAFGLQLWNMFFAAQFEALEPKQRRAPGAGVSPSPILFNVGPRG